MTARLLQVVVLLLAIVAAWWAAHWMLQGMVVTAIVGALLILLMHVPVLAVEFLLMHAANRRDPTPRASLRELVAAWWAECRLGLTVFAWWQPFLAHRHDDHLPQTRGARRGVVLVHGFMCNRGMWNGWMPRLKALDIPFVAVTLEPTFATIDRYADAVGDAVRRVTAATGMTPLVVAHSMGGLATRAWLRRLQSESPAVGVHEWVNGVVTLGTPHHGTTIGQWNPAPNVMEMRIDSGWLRDLGGTESTALRQSFVCFYSHCDNIVFPASSATLRDADNRHVRAMAHMQLIEHPDVFGLVLERCRGQAAR